MTANTAPEAVSQPSQIGEAIRPPYRLPMPREAGVPGVRGAAAHTCADERESL
jgi:hypothetical protein